MELCQTQSDELGVQSPPPAWDASFLEPRRAAARRCTRDKAGPLEESPGALLPFGNEHSSGGPTPSRVPLHMRQ